jgi:hypothetical protein
VSTAVTGAEATRQPPLSLLRFAQGVIDPETGRALRYGSGGLVGRRAMVVTTVCGKTAAERLWDRSGARFAGVLDESGRQLGVASNR